ncbi:MAG: glycosyltransferase, partial [Candidatus Shapirobacteria bacterium]|nr:glycosyltransferase [Candidatus Shapirobacteria bacterium]
MINPILSIIIISYNTSQLTIDCLKSILKDKGLTFDLTKINDKNLVPTEIIIVDNNSPDDSVAQIKKLKKSLETKNWKLEIIENKFNAGFGKANNQ